MRLPRDFELVPEAFDQEIVIDIQTPSVKLQTLHGKGTSTK